MIMRTAEQLAVSTVVCIIRGTIGRLGFRYVRQDSCPANPL
jgi:hypothetical protein